MKTYPTDYIDATEARILRQLGLLEQAQLKSPLAGEVARNVVLALELSFVHRIRAVEGKDGNPLNEVRIVAASILEHGAVLTGDKTIKYKPEASVLGLAVGDPIDLTFAQVRQLAEAFFADLRAKFT